MPYKDPRKRAATVAAHEQRHGLKLVGVRLDADTRRLLEKYATELGSGKADVIRLALLLLDREVAEHQKRESPR